MLKDPFKEWDRVDTFCTLLVDLGRDQITVLQFFRPLIYKYTAVSSILV